MGDEGKKGPGKEKRAKTKAATQRARRRASQTQFNCTQWTSFVRLYEKSLSRNRMLLRMAEKPAKGTPVDVALVLPDKKVLELRGKVIRTADPPAGSELFMVGVALEFDSGQRRTIRKILRRIGVTPKSGASTSSAPSAADARPQSRPKTDTPPKKEKKAAPKAQNERPSYVPPKPSRPWAETPMGVMAPSERELAEEESSARETPRGSSPPPARAKADTPVSPVPARRTPRSSSPPPARAKAANPVSPVPARRTPRGSSPPPRLARRDTPIATEVEQERVATETPLGTLAPDQSELSQPASPAPRPSAEPIWRAKRTRTSPIVGIDFGTSYCTVAHVSDLGTTLIPDEAGRTAIPSVVWFRDKEDYVVGYEAREALATDPGRVIPSIKRLLGCRIDDNAAAPVLMSLACPGRPGPNSSIVFDFNGEEQSPVMIAAIILRHLKALADAHLDADIEKAVIAYPLSFGEHQRSEIEKAARIAGIEPMAFIPEPVAAATAFGRDSKRDGMVGVYDFGGGTFDFCAMSMKAGAYQVTGAGGDPWLGGDDIDSALANYAADEFWRETKIDLRKRAVEWQRLLHAAEEAKVYLSVIEGIDVFVPDVARLESGMVDLELHVTRDKLEELTREIVENSVAVCKQALDEAHLSLDDITDLVLTGGTTKVPAVRDAAQAFFGREADERQYPEQAVAVGTAIRAAEFGDGEHSVKSKRQSRSVAGTAVGLALAGGDMSPLIHRTAPLPAVVKKVFSTTENGQTLFSLKIVQAGENAPSKLRPVGKLKITGLKPLPAGQVRVEVVFRLDETQVLDVTARDLTTGRSFSSTFQLD